MTLEARFRLDSYLLEVESYNENLGLVMIKDSSYDYSLYAKQRYDYTSKVSIAAYTKTSENRFLGWFDSNGELVETDTVYTFTMPFTNINYVAKFFTNSYLATAESESSSKGSVIGTGNYLYKTSVTFVATPNKGYSFIGWYDGETLISNESEYTFEMPSKDVSYTAKFSTNSYAVNVSSEDTSKGTVTGSGTYEYGSIVTLSVVTAATTLDNPYKISFAGWYKNDQLLSIEESYSFVMPAEDLKIVGKFDLISLATGDIIYYGNYPQSIVYDTSLKNKLAEKAGVLPTSDNSSNWTTYNWYISSSNETKYAWYIDLDINEDGQNDYRGVYFTSYRPDINSDKSSILSSTQYDNGYRTSNIYWFKYEPLEWRILNNNEGDYLIMSNKIIDCEQYSMYTSSNLTLKTDYQGNTAFVYPNNYQYSDLRTFLNENFYLSAFSAKEKEKIQTTTIDNSASTNRYLSNDYVCENTEDKIFALSFWEVMNPSYGFGDNNQYADERRELKVSDYAACMGCRNGGKYDPVGIWWLRSPHNSDSTEVSCVYGDGSSNRVSSTMVNFGVVPALTLR